MSWAELTAQAGRRPVLPRGRWRIGVGVRCLLAHFERWFVVDEMAGVDEHGSLAYGDGDTGRPRR
jgi:hypothetical protein